MKHPLLLTALCASLLGLAAEPCHAHGGQYMGPPDIVPPNPGGGGGRSPGGSPSTPGPKGPPVPGPRGPGGAKTPGPAPPGAPPLPGGAPGRGPKTGGTSVMEIDFTTWDVWWEFNKNPYIRLKEAIHGGAVQTGSDIFYMGRSSRVASRDTLRPTDEQILQVILPALKRAMDSTDDRDIHSSCMVAMAKIGRDHPDFRLLEVFKGNLTSSDQEIRETAALAIGIAQLADADAVELLVDLACDRPAGRRAMDRNEVDDRTRSFACYGLGLVAHATGRIEIKTRIFEALAEVLADETIVSRNLRVASIIGLGLLRPGPADDEAAQALLQRCLAALEAYYRLPLGSGQQLIQSHCPTAIARLVARDHPRAPRYREMFAADLTGTGDIPRDSNDTARSCALALGQLCRPYDDEDSEDARFSELLLDYYENGKDQQARYFSLLALGQIGGNVNRNRLLVEFDRGSKALEKPWAAMALGVLDHARRAGRADARPDEMVGGRLARALAENKNPDTLSALAVSLGLLRHLPAAAELRAMLDDRDHQEKLAGYLCIGLALMGDEEAIPVIQDVIDRSVRRPLLVQQAAIALGKLGDKLVADRLLALLDSGDRNLARMSAVASALGFIGDQRTVEPLRSMLFADDLTPLTRAFAAVALGGVADKEVLPWNSKIAENINYRAAVETLTNQAAGVLDIL